jgi:cytosine/adenosine deaminase-related metal-dependent hydrolase
MRLINATEGLDATGRLSPLSITIEDDRITKISKITNKTEDLIILPALVNAHDHARPLRSSSVGGFGKPLEAWLHRLAFMAPVDPYLATLAPLARAALGGQGAVMIHHVRPIGLTDYVTEGIQMARAARDVGVRVAFGVGMRVARASRSHLREMIVAGKRILHQGKIIGVDLDAVQKELRIAYRAAMPSRAGFLNAWPGFEAAICAHYQNRLGCC